MVKKKNKVLEFWFDVAILDGAYQRILVLRIIIFKDKGINKTVKMNYQKKKKKFFCSNTDT